MAGIVYVNPSAGTADGERDGVRAAFPDSEVVDTPPAELEDRVREGLQRGPAWIGVAGGDGTLRCVAEALVGTDVPLLVIPAGTRNHFAREVGIDDLETAQRAAGGATRAVDVGEVNGRCFINNSSIGLYPKVVVTREAHEHRMPKRWANIVAIWEQVRHGHRFWASLDGRRIKAWMVFVGNGCYGERLGDLATREALDEGVLDVRVVRADRPFARIRIVGALLFGRLASSPLHIRWVCHDVRIELGHRSSVEVALDGEVERFTPPLDYRIRPKALRVFVPAGAD